MIDASKTLALGGLVVCVNVVLMVIKIVVGIVGGSYALIADGIESAGDIFSSLITWAGFQLSLRPADATHPFGHGKFESLAGLFSGVALLVAAGIIAWNSVASILTPHGAPEWFTLPVLLGVIAIKLLLARKVAAVSKATGSRALESDAWHHFSDAITSAAAALGITIAIVGGKGWESADGYAALVACVIIVINGTLILKGSLHEVLDGSVPIETEQEIKAHAQEVAGVKRIEKCRVRKSGTGILAEMHVWVDGDATVREGHGIAHAVKDHLQSVMPQILDVVIHIEPTV